MNKIISFLAVAMFAAGSIITGCQSPEQKEENAQEKVQDAKEDLNEAKQEANAQEKKVADAEEWRVFKLESQEKIRDNEVRIAELKEKKKKPGKVLDPLYEKRIETLEQKNNELKAKIDEYERNQSDWESFKREFNHDMEELGQSLKDITVDNKK